MHSIEMPDFLNIYLILLGWDNPDTHMNSPWQSQAELVLLDLSIVLIEMVKLLRRNSRPGGKLFKG